jgi:cytochrome c oxidase subunit 2
MTRMAKETMAQLPVPFLTRAGRALRAGLMALPAALLAGCFKDLRQSTVHPESDTGKVIQDVYKMVTWIDTGIFILVMGLLVWAVWRYRESKTPAGTIPEQVHGNPVLEVMWTIVPAVILIFIAVPTWSGIFRNATLPKGGGMKVEAIGHQWWWEFKYSESGLVTANELHVPVGKTVEIMATSKDVIHAFWVPKLAGKMDAFPGRQNLIWFTPEKVGMYYGQCAEFCSTSHANMRFRVIVDSEADFAAWMERTKKPQLAKTDEAKAGEQLFQEKGCITCHTINGKNQAAFDIAPNLTNLKDRTSIASALIDNTPENLTRWIKSPRDVKPGVLMCWPPQMDRTSHDCGKFPVTDDEIAKLIAYLNSPSAGATAEYDKAAQPAVAASALK